MSVPVRSAGEQVGGELEPLELSADDPGKGAHRQCLGQSRNSLKQDMAVAQKPDDETLHHVALADDHTVHLLQDAIDRLGIPMDAFRYRVYVGIDRHGNLPCARRLPSGRDATPGFFFSALLVARYGRWWEDLRSGG